MRLWHKDLIPVLPRQQLLGQWRECCLIAKNIAEKGTPNHLLVNKIMAYSIDHFRIYSQLIYFQLLYRDFKVNVNSFSKWIPLFTEDPAPAYSDLFSTWHNERYLMQCYHNLQEKYDCGGISDTEWKNIVVLVKVVTADAGVIVTDFNPDNPIIDKGNIIETREEP